MDPLGKKELISFYNRHLEYFGNTPQALRWTPEGQRKRYEALCKISGDITDKRILDFGCGMGDFYGFLRDRGIRGGYCGIDINEKIINLAKQKYPEAEFLALDIEEEDFQKEFDVVFVCGVFNLKVADVENSMKNALKHLFSLTRETLHLDCLSYYTNRRDVELFYVKPEELLAFTIQELSRKVTLRHGLVEGDIILSVYK